MQFKIADIQFDCSLDSDDGTRWNQRALEKELREEYVATVWEADNEEDLIEEITAASGWVIYYIKYLYVLS